MRKECLASLGALLAGAGLSLAQPAPEVLSSPAPTARGTGARTVLPPDLPPVAGSSPGVFPFPVTGACETPCGAGADLPPCIDPIRQDPAGLKECDRPHCHVWASAEPLLWWVREGPTPAPLTGAGDGSLDYGMLVGGRVAAGFVNAAANLGVDGGGFWLERGAAHLVAVPGSGAPTATSSSQLWGAETNVVGNAVGCNGLAIDLLGGLRYVDLDETLAVAQAGNSPAGGGSFAATDSLRTRNQFFGGQLGSQVEMRFGRLYTNLLGKVAVGNVHQVVDVSGTTTASGSGGSATVPGGVLAAGANSGRQSHDEFGVVPEVNFNVGYQLSPCVRLYAGYTFLYLNDVARPGDQGNATTNTALVPAGPQFGTPGGPTLPGQPFNRTDYWAQGINIGLALRY
jgi:hypothetical protein